eukprot:SAG11_NODE_8988_length_956_cov_0.808635_1_plen_88_part_01
MIEVLETAVPETKPPPSSPQPAASLEQRAEEEHQRALQRRAEEGEPMSRTIRAAAEHNSTIFLPTAYHPRDSDDEAYNLKQTSKKSSV